MTPIPISSSSALPVRATPPQHVDPGSGPRNGAPFNLLPVAPATAPDPSLVGRLEAYFATYSTHIRRAQERTAALDAREKELRSREGFKPDMPEYRQLQTDRMNELLQLQIESHRVAFGVETAAKVIEHATSGARTLLQTQT